MKEYILLIIVAVLANAGVDGQSLTDDVQTTSGRVTGTVENEAFVFREIPYAVPPIGDMRFKPAVPLNTPNVTVNATVDKGTVCPQNLPPCQQDNCYDYQVTEDCLILNMFVPKSVDLTDTGKAALKPVMLYIHGGGFLISAEQTFDGRYLANETDIIIVTFLYRLGPLGFLNFNDGINTINGNEGIHDQRLAMTWVKDNIENFGGNPDKVTLVGESAGAQSVTFHLLASESEPLFEQAIIQSNPALMPLLKPSQAEYVTQRLLDHLNCSTDEEYNCLMSASYTDLLAILEPLQSELRPLVEQAHYDSEPFRPVLDGVEFTQQPMEAFRDGNWQTDKRIIIGTTTEELDMLHLIPDDPTFNSSLYFAVNSFGYGMAQGQEVSQYYAQLYPPDENGNYGRTYSKQLTHLTFICPTRKLARFASTTSTLANGIYMYSYAHKRLNGTCEINHTFFGNSGCGFAYHASELMFLFRTGNQSVYSDNDFIVENQLSLYWGNFVSHSNPSYSTDSYAVAWPAYENVGTTNDEVWNNIIIDAPVTSVQENYLNDICDFWDRQNFFIPDNTSPTTTPITDTTSSQSAPVGLYHFHVIIFSLMALNFVA